MGIRRCSCEGLVAIVNGILDHMNKGPCKLGLTRGQELDADSVTGANDIVR